ncbi:MAG TPA: S-layer homology domain-containing protein, partial [Clostridiaceae bacterium]|nr:S-layer homology domain-containing protein [Clostridiaceae bacterium]
MKLWNSGLLVGDEQGNFNPRHNATRAEAATFCGRLFDTTSSIRENIQEPGQNTASDLESGTDSNTGPNPGLSIMCQGVGSDTLILLT